MHENNRPHDGQLLPQSVKGVTCLIGLFVDDVEFYLQRTFKNGAQPIMPTTHFDYHYRQAEIKDPFGMFGFFRKNLSITLLIDYGRYSFFTLIFLIATILFSSWRKKHIKRSNQILKPFPRKSPKPFYNCVNLSGTCTQPPMSWFTTTTTRWSLGGRQQTEFGHILFHRHRPHKP